MSIRNYPGEWAERCKQRRLAEEQRRLEEGPQAAVQPEEAPVSAVETGQKLFNVVRCTLPATVEVPVFFGVPHDEARLLACKVLRSHERVRDGWRWAEYHDWRPS